MTGVLREGVVISVVGIVAGAACGFVLARVAGSYFPEMKLPGVVPVAGSAVILLAAAVVASVLPAARIDVIQALRAD